MKCYLSWVVPFMLSLCSGAIGSQLSVEPILLEFNAPAAAGVMKLRNGQDIEVTVQVRVFRWSQVNGRESLEPTTEVVASPPAAKLAPHADYTVRIVRTSKSSVSGEESYRVVVDQLPDLRQQAQNAVNILVRQSIPVFFRSAHLTRANVSWLLAYKSGQLVIRATNNGDERLRIASLQLRDNAGSTIDFGNGLAGYALGRSSIDFVVTQPPKGFGLVGPVSITAQTNNGAISAAAMLETQR